MQAEVMDAFNSEAAKNLPPMDACCSACQGWGVEVTGASCSRCGGDGLDHYARREREKGVEYGEAS